jgi:hypothetical protein
MAPNISQSPTFIDGISIDLAMISYPSQVIPKIEPFYI